MSLTDEPDPSTPGTSAPVPRPCFRWLCVLVIGFVALMFALSTLRYLQLATGDWDVGTIQQALWSTTHGYPMYEADSYEVSGAASAFQIHPSFLLVALVPVYELAPSALTLFGVQAVAVGVAAIPLYLLAKDVTGSERKALLSAAVYLVFPPLISANLADFHLESFLPLEIFALLLFWNRSRYVLGSIAAVAAIVTIEVGPILVASVAVLFLVGFDPFRWGDASSRLRLQGVTAVFVGALRSLPAQLKGWLGIRRVRASLILLVGSGVAYLILRFIETFPGVVGLAPGLVPGNAPLPFVGGALNISTATFTAALDQKLEYWLLLYGLLAFLPLRALRTQLLALPWVAYTLVSLPTFTVLGRQYGFVAAIPLVVGFVYGIRDLSIPSLRSTWRILRPARSPPPTANMVPMPKDLAGRAPRWDLWKRHPEAFAVILLVILVGNVAVGPLDPAVQNNQQGSGYQVHYEVPSGFWALEGLAAQVPAGAVVVASDDLFPLVANDVHAYTLFPPGSLALNNFPFNSTHLPTFVFLSLDETAAVPTWLDSMLGQSTVYSVVGVVSNAPKGGATLYEVLPGAAVPA